MSQIMQIIYGLVFLLSLTIPFHAKAATLTYVGGSIHTDAFCLYTEEYKYSSGFPSAYINVGSSHSSGRFSIHPSIIGLHFLGECYPFYHEHGPFGSTASTHVSFKVENTIEDSLSYGSLYYRYDFQAHNFHGENDSYFRISINGNIVLEKYWRPWHGLAESMSGSFDVDIGDLIGIWVSVGGSFDGDYGYYSSILNSTISVDKAFVPLPSALLLLGAGLFRLAAYGRRKQG